LNINECIDSLKTSAESIGGAPEKGFLDLDLIKETLQKTRLLLEQIAPQLELGVRLKEDLIKSLQSKINALKIAGCGQFMGQTEKALEIGQLDFDQLKLLQKEIDQTLAKNFGALKSPAAGITASNLNDYH
jgi:hypothetical protein